MLKYDASRSKALYTVVYSASRCYSHASQWGPTVCVWLPDAITAQAPLANNAHESSMHNEDEHHKHEQKQKHSQMQSQRVRRTNNHNCKRVLSVPCQAGVNECPKREQSQDFARSKLHRA